MASSFFFTVHAEEPSCVLRLQSPDGTNRLTSACVLALTEAVGKWAGDARSLVITGNQKLISRWLVTGVSLLRAPFLDIVAQLLD